VTGVDPLLPGLEEMWLSRPDNGHVLAVSRTDVVSRMVAEGRQSKDIFITGSPMFDRLAEQNSSLLWKLWREKHCVSIDKKVVFWAEQPEPLDPELPRKVRNHLAKVCEENGWLLVVRLHPSSTDETKEKIPADCIQSHAHESLIEVIHGCDVAVTLTSTVGWEALRSQKPLLVLNISPYSYATTFGDDDGALALDTLGDAEIGLKTLLYGGKEAEKLKALRQALPKSGGATDRVCDLLETEVFERKVPYP